MKKILLIPFILLLAGCEKECTLPRIPDNVFNLKNIGKTIILKNNATLDTAKVIEVSNYYEKTSFKGPMNVRECEHYKSYEVEFKGERINVSVRKYIPDTLELDVIAFGTCSDFPSEKKMAEKELLLNKEYIFEQAADCNSSNSNIKRVILKGHVIKSITTSDDKVWISE